MAQKVETKICTGTIKEKEEKEYPNFQRFNYKIQTENSTRDMALSIFENVPEEKKVMLEAMAKDFNVGDKVKIEFYEKGTYLNITSIEDADAVEKANEKYQVKQEVPKKADEPKKEEPKPLRNVMTREEQIQQSAQEKQSFANTQREQIRRGQAQNNACQILAPSTIELEYKFILENFPKRIFDLAEKILEEGKKRNW